MEKPRLRCKIFFNGAGRKQWTWKLLEWRGEGEFEGWYVAFDNSPKWYEGTARTPDNAIIALGHAYAEFTRGYMIEELRKNLKSANIVLDEEL